MLGRGGVGVVDCWSLRLEGVLREDIGDGRESVVGLNGRDMVDCRIGRLPDMWRLISAGEGLAQRS